MNIFHTHKQQFSTDFIYTDREGKGRYVWEKYKTALCVDDILDVGADKGVLAKHLPHNVRYHTIGFGASIDQEYNLENCPYPFEDMSFDVVLCLDVLEHLEHIHAAFDECCRIAKKTVIISLPNPYADFMQFLRSGKYRGRKKDMKFYGLQPEPEEDRHRCFFSPTDAQEFINYRSRRMGFSVVQFDSEYCEIPRPAKNSDNAFRKLFRDDIDFFDLECGPLWWVLKRNDF